MSIFGPVYQYSFKPNAGTSGSVINDAIISLTSTWSSDKINAMITGGSTEQLVQDIPCDVTVGQGSLVFLFNNILYPAINNQSINPVIGICLSINGGMSHTLLLGRYTQTVSLTVGQKVFVDTNGLPTSVKPAGGYLQVLGIATDQYTIFFNPMMTRVLQ